MDAHLRVARPTDRLETIVKMYQDGLGLEILGSFEGHSGFDGVMLGNAGMELAKPSKTWMDTGWSFKMRIGRTISLFG
jgi:hypothetical protein